MNRITAMLEAPARNAVVMPGRPDVQVTWLPASGVPKLRPRLSGPLVVDAGDGIELEGPLRVAQVLARRDRVRVHVLAVVEPLRPLPAVVASISTGLDSTELDESRRRVARQRARARVSEHVGLSAFFGTSAAIGPRVPTLASAARAESASYVLTGLPVHITHREDLASTASRLATEAATPVLAVPSTVALPIRSVLAAVDFGPASVAAARAAAPLLGDGGSITLLHVVPAPLLPYTAPAADGALETLRALGREIAETGDLAVYAVVLQGDPAAVLAEWTSAFDLVTLGASRRDGRRLGIATGPSAIAFRHARGALLVAPEPPGDGDIATVGSAAEAIVGTATGGEP